MLELMSWSTFSLTWDFIHAKQALYQWISILSLLWVFFIQSNKKRGVLYDFWVGLAIIIKYINHEKSSIVSQDQIVTISGIQLVWVSSGEKNLSLGRLLIDRERKDSGTKLNIYYPLLYNDAFMFLSVKWSWWMDGWMILQ